MPNLPFPAQHSRLAQWVRVNKRTLYRTVCAAAVTVLVIQAAFPAFAQGPAKPAATAAPTLFLEDASPKGLVQTVDAFKESVKAGGWSILNTTNMAGILSEKGYALQPVLIFDACSGKYSAELLGRDETRFVASMIPCRVAIYQTSKGRVIISRMNSVAMADMVGGAAGAVIKKSGEEMEHIVKATLKKLK